MPVIYRSTYIGTTFLSLNRASNIQTLTGVNVDGYSGTVLNTNLGATSIDISTFTTTAEYSKPAGYQGYLASNSNGLPLNVTGWLAYNVVGKKDVDDGTYATLIDQNGNMWFGFADNSNVYPTWTKIQTGDAISSSFATTGSNTFYGNQTINGSLSNGLSTAANGNYSHAEGDSTTANGNYSHAEGSGTTTNGDYSHAEGENTTANGYASHAEGSGSIAQGDYSHAEGLGTIANGSYQTVVGKYNKQNNTSSLFIIGNGVDNSNRNDLVLFNTSSVEISGSLIVNNQTLPAINTLISSTQTGSFTTTSSFNSFTSSINNKTGSFVTTSSFNSFTSSINNFTSSVNSSISSIISVLGTKASLTDDNSLSGINTFTGGNDLRSSIKFFGYNQQGGEGYYGYYEVENSYPAVINPKKYFRIDPVGSWEIRNNVNDTTILSLTDAGVFETPGGGTSDRRTKNNIEYISNDISSIINQLKPVKFEFKTNPGKTRHGFIAQDVLEIKPDLVLGDGDKENGTYGLDYDGILALTVKALQESNKKIFELETMIKELQNKIK